MQGAARSESQVSAGRVRGRQTRKRSFSSGTRLKPLQVDVQSKQGTTSVPSGERNSPSTTSYSRSPPDARSSMPASFSSRQQIPRGYGGVRQPSPGYGKPLSGRQLPPKCSYQKPKRGPSFRRRAETRLGLQVRELMQNNGCATSSRADVEINEGKTSPVREAKSLVRDGKQVFGLPRNTSDDPLARKGYTTMSVAVLEDGTRERGGSN